MFCYYRSCFEERKAGVLCKGVPFCENKGDLRWCKSNASSHIDIKPIFDDNILSCNSLGDRAHLKSINGQQIKNKSSNVFLEFRCFNRKDLNPFASFKGRNQSKWLKNVNKKCKSGIQNRCLGQESEQCSNIRGKFWLLILAGLSEGGRQEGVRPSRFWPCHYCSSPPPDFCLHV